MPEKGGGGVIWLKALLFNDVSPFLLKFVNL